MIVVVDSSVWISALNYGGIPRQALEYAIAADELATCEQIIAEITRVLLHKLDWDRQRVDQSLRIYLSDTESVIVAGNVRGICRDPKDDMVLECAKVANAQVIVTGDKDLLALREYEGIRVLSPRDYLDENRVSWGR